MATKPSASITSITFSSGQKIKLKKNEKIVLVGPNNSGKSQSLREIVILSNNGNHTPSIVISKIEILKTGTSRDLKAFLDEKATRITNGYLYGHWALGENIIRHWDTEGLRHGLHLGFMKNIAANERLKICEQQPSIGPGEQKSKPQHVLYDDSNLMDKVSGLFRQAFGSDLMFDFRGGQKLPIHVGGTPHENLVDRVSDSYVKEVRKNPLLDQQGDGIKSYAGILFESVVADLDITLIDEPEAFLHPPQMRRLGETLASEVHGQLVVATHSSDIMRGFLEGTKGNVRILRLRREGDKNFVAEASPGAVRELWETPVLRYSNALEGIFHEQTIICEDDSDCRLINSIADHLAAKSDDQWIDTAYVPTGGKHGIPKVASVLRKIGVPVKAVFDLDFLSEQSLLETTVQAFGGEWAEIKPIWARLDAAVRKGIRSKTVDEIKNDIKSIIDDSEKDALPKGDINEAMKQSGPWHQVKSYGSIAIPKGDAQKDYANLRDMLEKIGIFLVPVGEMENFCPELGKHGPKFVTKLLTEVPLDDDRLSELRIFAENVHKGPHSPLDQHVDDKDR